MNIALSLFKLFGSLALFLFGMTMMSENLQKVAGDKLRSFLAMMTSNAFKRIKARIVNGIINSCTNRSTLLHLPE